MGNKKKDNLNTIILDKIVPYNILLTKPGTTSSIANELMKFSTSINSCKKTLDQIALVDHLKSFISNNLGFANSYAQTLIANTILLFSACHTSDGRKPTEARLKDYLYAVEKLQALSSQGEHQIINSFLEGDYIEPPEAFVYCFALVYASRHNKLEITTTHIDALIEIFKAHGMGWFDL